MIQFRQKFIEEASDILQTLEQTILDLENSPNNSALIEEVFRAMHTLKGTASMFGFEQIGQLTHHLENIYDLIRNGRIPVDRTILDLTLETVDFLNINLKAEEHDDFSEEFKVFEDKIARVYENNQDIPFDGNQREIESIAKQMSDMQTWFIRIKPVDDLEDRGIKIHYIFDDLTETGKIHIYTRENVVDSNIDSYWEIILITDQPQDEIDDILMFIEDICEVELLANVDLLKHEFFQKQIQELTQSPVTDIAAFKTLISQELAMLSSTEEASKSVKIETKQLESIKVSSDRLDEQMNLLSELVTTRAEIQLMIQQNGYKPLMKASEQLEKITRRFQKNIFKIRLLPLATMQLRFDRLIRDLSKQLNKDVEFITEGMNTELDKNIIDSLESPLMHLIRNCLDHGIESPDIRKMRGKEGKGKITLSARLVAANVFITISDDGEGINKTKIKEKGIDKGLINKEEALTDQQIYDLIFLPGFSTSQTLTEVSGRGVGMDVVKKTISDLRGSIEVSSEKGEGSVFTIKLPLTLSIIDTMLVKAEDLFYSIPLTAIDKCTEVYSSELNARDNHHINIEGSLLPYIMVSDYFKVTDNDRTTNSAIKPKLKVVVIKNENHKTALIVDEVIAEHQAVLKPMGDYFKELEYFSGASQLANGRIALVIDTSKLISQMKTPVHIE